MTDRIIQMLAAQKETQVRDSVLSVVNSLARLVFTVQLKELEIRVESAPDATDIERANVAAVLESDTLATKLLSRRFGEEWRKEAMHAAEQSLADLRTEFPAADISGDLAFLDGLETAIALIHAKIKACNAKMLADAMPKGEPMRPGGPSVGHAAATAAQVVNDLASETALAEMKEGVREIIATPFEPDSLAAELARERGETIPEPPDMREIRELGSEGGDVEEDAGPI
jgi:hypothetical protein